MFFLSYIISQLIINYYNKSIPHDTKFILVKHMNNIIPVTYLILVYIMLIPIAYLITLQALNFIYNIYTFKIFQKQNSYINYTYKEYMTLSNLYTKQKLWTLALNNLENALELQSTIPEKIIIEYLNEIGFIYSQTNYTFLSSEYY
uniref:Uncharacterized protein n=1 Tax=Sheathia arcuata TaxID=340433 RepID=A0A3G1I9B0_9FLOR|nr:hypothetical protein [Sheathia arcuata]ART65536.1 hypothetical protein [Sheathia arcuata]